MIIRFADEDRQLRLPFRRETAAKMPEKARAKTPKQRMRRTRSGRMQHTTRPELNGPAHVVLRIKKGLPGLRTPRALRVLERCFRRCKEKDGFRLLEFSVQEDHLHFVVEAESKEKLSRGMQGLLISIAKRLNFFWHRKLGQVFSDRYFALALEKFMQLRRTLLYVLNNGRKHGVWSDRAQPDPYSSGRWFRWWIQRDDIRRPLRSPPVARPRSLQMAYVGSFDVAETPGSFGQFLEWLDAQPQTI